MRGRALLFAGLVALPLACGGTDTGGSHATVGHVSDGDTIVLAEGRHVRLVQLDAPEREGECYGQEATRVLTRLLPEGTRVELESDQALDRTDRFGRTLAYVRKDGVDVNLELVRQGAAAPYFFHGDRGRYAAQFLQAAEQAKRDHRGLWAACPRTVLDPLHAVDARP
jgi:micrococcal nuclease